MPIMTWDEWIAMSDSGREEFWKKTRYLVLDRQERKLYVGTHPNVTLFLSTVPLPGAPERDDEDEDQVPDEEFEAKVNAAESAEIFGHEPELTSHQPVEVSREVLEDLRSWLDQKELADDDYTPGPAVSCGFRSTYIRVESGQIEEAFGYGGGRRYITLHWSPKADQVFVCDGIGRWQFSGAVDTWNQFLNHPLVKPHLQGWDESLEKWRSVQIDFSARIGDLPEFPLFPSERAAREMEADVKTSCILYDRAKNEFYAGSWGSAILFHSLVEDVLEEDLVPDARPRPIPLMRWLDERQDDPAQVFAVATSHHNHHQTQEALEMLRRCTEAEPTSPLYWCRLSQTLGSLSRWDEGLEAIEKAIKFHASAPRQYVSAEYMIKWKGDCLFSLGRYSEAVDTYRFAIEIDQSGDKADLYSELGRCYERLGSYREAIRARELQARERADSLAEAQRCCEPDEVEDLIVGTERFFLGEAWFDLGRCYLLEGEFAAAEWAFRRAIETDGECVQATAELGALLRCLGRAGEGETCLQKALDLATRKVEENPTLGSAHRDLALVCRALGRFEDAQRSDDRATEL